MKPFLAAVLSVMIASEAHALSCRRPDIVASYNGHAQSNESYVVVRGKFHFAPPPKQPVRNDAKEVTVNARFEGVALSRRAFDTSFTRPLKITFACSGPWCGSVKPNTEAIAFVEQTDAGLHLFEGPCMWSVFYEPTKEQTDRLLLCHARGICD